MPHYTLALEVPRPLAELFAFFTRPTNLVQLAPADLQLQLLSAPDVLVRGARLVWQGRRWGIAQKIIQEVARFEDEKLIVVEQKQGPFARWVHAHHFTATEAGTRIEEKIDFEPPGGLLGRLISADTIRKDLDKLFAYRSARLKERFAEPRP